MVNKDIYIFVQARETSTRFPKKIFKKLGNKSIIEIMVERLKKTKIQNQNIVFLIPSNKKNSSLELFLKRKNINYFKGSEKNVLSRYYLASNKLKAKTIIRLTGDCPFVDPNLINKMLKTYQNDKKLEYFSNICPPSFPDGLDVEIFSKKALNFSFKESQTSFDKEHVTTKIRRSNNLNKKNLLLSKNYNNIKISVDNKIDYKNIKFVYNTLKKNNKNFGFKDVISNKKILNYFDSKKENLSILKNQTKNSRILWQRANKFIPGGNMLLSKNPDRFLPEFWPPYYKKAKGCKIIDLDNNVLTDIYLMGVGTNILGYANNEIDKAVAQSIRSGNMSSLNSIEELKLAEKLLELHPHFEMVKFARTGGEANSIAIRIARAASNRDKVAICGYHGWHDWYLSANLKEDKLKGHLMKGLEIRGVPKALSNTTIPFEYGDYKRFNQIISNKQIGVVKMEVSRNSLPNKKFLHHVRKKTKENNIVLIFDECTTGFRETFGGLHKKINIFPDMLILGKALGNGYAITSVLGKKEIMRYAKQSFISSTFWTERSGYVAALKTLEIMKKLKSWEKITIIGKKIQKKWRQMFDYYNLEVDIKGIPALSTFTFKNNHNLYKTLISQEMLKKNYLAGNTVYTSICHNEKILNRYFYTFEDVLKKIAQCENGANVYDFLDTFEAKTDFKRLN